MNIAAQPPSPQLVSMRTERLEQRLVVLLAAIENARMRMLQAMRPDMNQIAFCGLAAEEMAKIIVCKNAFDLTKDAQTLMSPFYGQEAEARANDLRTFFGGDGYINKWVDNDGHASFEFRRDKEDAVNDASLECPRDHKGFSVQYERTLACVGGVVVFVDFGLDRQAEDF